MTAVPGTVFQVPPKSWAEIAKDADNVRSALGLSSVPYFPIAYVIETVLEDLYPGLLDVGDLEMMGGAEGQTAPDGSFIRLREDVYHALVAGDGRARFTAAHELGHFFLHQGATLERVAAKSIPAFRNSEAQANHFAACLLMPASLISPGMSTHTLMKVFGVSAKAAQNRFDNLGLKGIDMKRRTSVAAGPPDLFSRD